MSATVRVVMLVAVAAGGCSREREPAAPAGKPAAYARPTPGPRLAVEPRPCDGGHVDFEAPLVELTCRDVRHSVMRRPRAGLLAVTMPRGGILVVGGDPEGTAEVYEPAAARWREVPTTRRRRRRGAPDRLVATPAGAAWVGAAQVGERMAIDVAIFDERTGRWAPPESAPLAPVPGKWVPHVAAATLSDGALLVVSFDQAALRTAGGWQLLPALPPHERPLDWVVPLPGGDALVGGVFVLHRGTLPTWGDLRALAPRRVVEGDYAPIALAGGRVAIAGGCSDTGECWGDSEIDVFDPRRGRWVTTPYVLAREHSVGPAGVALSGDRLLLTSDFSQNRELEHCTIPDDARSTPVCRCGGCELPKRDRAAVVAGGGDCVLLLGGDADSEPTADVYRLCWSDAPWPRTDLDDLD